MENDIKLILCESDWPEENYKPFIVCELGDRTEEEGIQYGKEQYGKDAKIFIGTHLDLI